MQQAKVGSKKGKWGNVNKFKKSNPSISLIWKQNERLKQRGSNSESRLLNHTKKDFTWKLLSCFNPIFNFSMPDFDGKVR